MGRFISSSFDIQSAYMLWALEAYTCKHRVKNARIKLDKARLNLKSETKNIYNFL